MWLNEDCIHKGPLFLGPRSCCCSRWCCDCSCCCCCCKRRFRLQRLLGPRGHATSLTRTIPFLHFLSLSLSPLSPIRHPPSLTPLSKRRKGIDATQDSCNRGNILWVFGESFRCFNFFFVLTCLNWNGDGVGGINVAKIYFFLRERGGREYWLFFFYFSLVKENWEKFAIVSIMQCIIIFVRIINVGRRGGCVAKPSAAEL